MANDERERRVDRASVTQVGRKTHTHSHKEKGKSGESTSREPGENSGRASCCASPSSTPDFKLPLEFNVSLPSFSLSRIRADQREKRETENRVCAYAEAKVT